MLCQLQRIWMVLAMICHGLLAGLALTHLLLVMSINISEWSSSTPLETEAQTLAQTITPDMREIMQAQSAPLPALQPFLTTATQLSSNLTNSQVSQDHKNKVKTTKDYNNNNHKNINSNENNDDGKELLPQKPLFMQTTYLTFSNIYLKTFYCLTVVCILSVFDRYYLPFYCFFSFQFIETFFVEWIFVVGHLETRQQLSHFDGL